jgi:hypothetical protein
MLMQFLIGRRSALAMLAAFMLAVPGSGRAQEPRRLAQSDSIPVELATALISAGGLGGEPQILVGSLPGWIANRLYLPSNARVVGSAFIGSSVVGVLNVADAPESVTVVFKRELAKRAWKSPPPAPSYGGGFRPAPSPMADALAATRLTLCGDQQILTTVAARRRGTTTEVVIRVVPAGVYSICNPPPTPSDMNRAPFPTLFNPAGLNDLRMASDCRATGGNTTGTGTMLRTAIDPSALLEHYARQLQDSGWHSTNDKPSIVGRTWTRTDSAGTPLDLTLTVTTSARDSLCRELSLQVRTLRKP